MVADAPETLRARRVRVRRALGIGFVAATVLGVSVVLFKSTVGWFFPVASGSMEPTLMTGESVFLRYGRSDLGRFDIVAFTDVGGGASVKRVVGLGGELILIEPTGDLRIEGKLRPDEPGRPAPIPMFDSTLQSIGEHWRHGGAYVDPWALAGDVAPGPDEVWEMDGSAVNRAADLGLLGLHDRIDDGRLLPNGERVAGSHAVHDVSVSFEVLVVEAGGRLRVQLTEQGDTFEASVPVYAGEDDTRMDVFRRKAASDPIEYLDYVRGPVPIGAWIPVRFSNIDNRLTFEIGATRLEVDYDDEGNTPHPMAYDLKPISPGERVRLGGEGLVLRVRRIRVERDFHIISRGEFAAGSELQLGADEVFVIGDASSASRDSRERGPISLDRVFGRAKAIVWPLGRARILR